MRYKNTGITKNISGVEHNRIDREDGFSFYLDPPFLKVLLSYQDQCIYDLMQREYGLDTDRVDQIIDMLKKAELLPLEAEWD